MRKLFVVVTACFLAFTAFIIATGSLRSDIQIGILVSSFVGLFAMMSAVHIIDLVERSVKRTEAVEKRLELLDARLAVLQPTHHQGPPAPPRR